MVGTERERVMRMNKDFRNYLDLREAAAWLGLSPRMLDRYCVSGEGPVFHRFGSRVRYLFADLKSGPRQGDGYPLRTGEEPERGKHDSDATSGRGSLWFRL